jgi:hypothetical protein
LRAFVGLVTGDVKLEQRSRGDVEFELTSAAVDDRSGSDGEAAFLADDADGFARGAAGGPNIFDDQHSFAGFDFKSAAKGHLAGAVPFDENRANAEGASDFVADDQSA